MLNKLLVRVLIFTSGICLLSSTKTLASQAFFTDFSSGVPSEFSGVTTTQSVQGYAGIGTGSNVFANNFLRNTTLGDPAAKTTLTLTGLPTHTSIDLNFLLAIIDSWDGETCCFDPDIFNVKVDGDFIFSKSFTNISLQHSASYPSPTTPANVVLAQEVQLGFNPDNIAHLDSAYNMGLEPIFQNILHTSSTLTIEWFASGGGWQGGSDESWAIDNVEVILNGTNNQSVPEPVSVLGLLTFGAFASFLLKRKQQQQVLGSSFK